MFSKLKVKHVFGHEYLLCYLFQVTDDALLIVSQTGCILFVSTRITDMIGFHQVETS